ncbi:Ig-like domain-containing protein [Methanosarcina sp. 2.H.A.1B.4]|jgi:hypothetical protein|uniref:Ig-like domain-containing protein n=1 Tax=Methanosarcina sp. 2.H.A.1B.4 TaxID=1483600 RepID=UPI0006213512|nr:Ig-like domain-containing protein [Methanosarcina sp. 2.H.A.1B.4]KKG13050.1 hypothetical protein EO92_07705 [Methanosarcina sp. 2.H.A.1B.4]
MGSAAGAAAGVVAGVAAGVVAGVTMKYTYDKYIHEQQVHKKLKSIPLKVFKRGPFPVTVKSVYPDRQTFSHNLKSPIWIEFDAPIDSSTVTKDTVIVKSSVSDEPVEGFLDAGNRILMFRPYGKYPVENGGAKVSITLIGTDTGSGAITDTKGVLLDGDKDGKAGGDFEYKFSIMR